MSHLCCKIKVQEYLELTMYINDVFDIRITFGDPNYPQRYFCQYGGYQYVLMGELAFGIAPLEALLSHIRVRIGQLLPNCEACFELHLSTYRNLLPMAMPFPCFVRGCVVWAPADAQLVGRWLSQLSAFAIPLVTVNVPRDEMIRGIGELQVVQNAQHFRLVGGYCDITDAQLLELKCETINFKSPFITAVGIKAYLERANAAEQFDAHDTFYCETPNGDVVELARQIAPRDYPFNWTITNGQHYAARDENL